MSTFRTAPTPDGAAIAWWSAGSGDPVILIAGQAVTRRSWDGIVPALAERFEVITFEQRGIGESSEGDDPPTSTRTMAEDVLRVMESAGIPRAHLIGHSMGGRIAQWMAIDHAEAVGAVVLIATTGGDDGGFARSPEATSDLASGDPVRLAPRFFSDAHLASDPAAIDVFVRKEGSLRTRRRAFAASAGHDAWAELSSIHSPTLIVHGSDDSVTPVENARALAAAIPHAQYLEVAGGRHALQLDHPVVVEAIIDFVARHPLGG